MVEGDPIITAGRHMTYLPVDPSIFLDRFNRWGLYHPDGRLVQAAAYRRLPVRALIGQSEHLPDLPNAEVAPAGSYLYGGPIIMQYGHFVTTALARLWPLVHDGWVPGTKIVVHSHQTPEDWFTRDYVRTIYGALGLSPNDFFLPDRPIRFEQILVPYPAMEEQNYIHRIFGKLCRAIGRTILDQRQQGKENRMLYLSKTAHRRGTYRLLNENEFQSALTARGIDIVHPESLPFCDQVHLLANSRMVAGTIGSGFHTSLFTPVPISIVGLAYGPTVNSNYQLIDKVGGNDATYVHSPDIVTAESDDALFTFAARHPEMIGEALAELILGCAP